MFTDVFGLRIQSGRARQVYLADIFARLPDHKINRLGELLPWNWTLAAKSIPIAA